MATWPIALARCGLRAALGQLRRAMATNATTTRSLRIAVVGCAHGELDSMYGAIRHLEAAESVKIDLLLCCGDFQAVRNENDLSNLACPAKYRSMNTFWKYYAGQEVAPCPTIFIGGNHEASNYLWELYYGGWVAPNIFYLGAAGIVQFGGVRIGGLSGIYKHYDYQTGHFERAPYDESQKRSIFHVREYDVLKLMQVSEPLDIFMSHDWPRGIAHCGDMQRLLRYKAFLEKEIANNTLGSEPAGKLLKKLKPSYWFSAHLHVKFPAVVQHPEDHKVTKFLALDKCLPGRGFLQVIEVPVPAAAAADTAPCITLDKEWLAITRAYNPVLPLQRHARFDSSLDLQLAGHRDWIEELAKHKELALTPAGFTPTAPAYGCSKRAEEANAGHVRNPQSEALLRLLELPYLLDSQQPSDAAAAAAAASAGAALLPSEKDPNEIILDEDVEAAAAAAADESAVVPTMPKSLDANEIQLPEEDDDE